MSWTNFELCQVRVTRMTARSGLFSTSLTESTCSMGAPVIEGAGIDVPGVVFLGECRGRSGSWLPQLRAARVSKFDFLVEEAGDAAGFGIDDDFEGSVLHGGSAGLEVPCHRPNFRDRMKHLVAQRGHSLVFTQQVVTVGFRPA